MLAAISIPEPHRETLQGHAQKNHPDESCAILYGRIDGDQVSVLDILLTDNAKPSPERFTISDGQLIEAYRKEEESGTPVVGIFHSHPASEAVPSETDRRFMEINPVVWVIYSGMGDNFRAFVANNGIREIEITS